MAKEFKQIALYGKGGIGKSTTSSNLSAALSQMGVKVMQIGCDPKSDSTTTLMQGKMIPTILRQMDTRGYSKESIKEVIFEGFNGILCAEAGGPKPGAGCAGKGVSIALDLVKNHNLAEEFDIDLALYDVLGDVVCGGFAQPMRKGYAEQVYLVSSGELMSLYAANNIAKSVSHWMSQGAKVSVAGIINNERNVPREHELMEEFSQRIKIPITIHIPRSNWVQKAELKRTTVIESFPDSDQAEVYRELAKKVWEDETKAMPEPLEDVEEIIRLLVKYDIMKF